MKVKNETEVANDSTERKQYIEPETLAKFRERFWGLCKKKGISLEDLADRTGISYTQIYRIVRGTANTSLSNVMAVIRAAELQPREVFDYDIDIPEYPQLRSKISKEEAKKRKARPAGGMFYLNEFIKDGRFAGKSYTSKQLTDYFNEDLGKNFSEAVFSTALSRHKALSRKQNSEGILVYSLK